MNEIIPDVHRLGTIFGIATAPAFFLGSIAGFVAIMSNRLLNHVDRLRKLNERSAEERAISQAVEQCKILQRRIRLLHQAIRLSLLAGINATGLLALLFCLQYFAIPYAYGVAVFFITSSILLGASLIRFAQEIWIGTTDWELV